MEELVLTFRDGSEEKVSSGATAADLFKKHYKCASPGIIAAKLNGRLIDLTHRLEINGEIEPVTFDSEEGKEIYRHSTSHIMAHAVKKVFPEAKLTIGPSTADGFYYDFDRDSPFTPDELKLIEERMTKIIESDSPFIREEISKKDAQKLFTEIGEPYKGELLGEIEDEVVTIYREDDFVDLCRGPHVASTSVIAQFKLLSTAGAYWRGDERNKMLQRIYGTAYPTEKELIEHIGRLEEAKKRDHRVLGKELSLVSINEEAGPGLIYWHPKGAVVRKIVERFWEEEHVKRGYKLVITPHIARDLLFKTSGHYDYYRENMFVLNIDKQEYVLKPMNCPGHIIIYKDRLHSYRELPIRYAELGTVYRYERSGVLHGMLRVRGFTQDDAHIFCTPDQLPEEVAGVVDLALDLLKVFGYEDFEVDLSVRDPENFGKYAGDNSDWEMAERTLKQVLESKGLKYIRRQGEAVFYGPKIDIKMLDALGRGWQGPTIQFDFNLPKRFSVTYISSEGKEQTAMMIHRTVLGSMERFIGGLIEHYAGAFPLWLAPVQIKAMNITERQITYAAEVARTLRDKGFRVEEDFRNQKIGLKIREAQLVKIPYMLIIGDREVNQGSVSVRHRSRGDLGSLALDKFIDMASEESASKACIK